MPRPVLALIAVLPVCLLAQGRGLAQGEAAPANLRFETSVRPILKAYCWQCHGEDQELKGGLDARLARFLLKGGQSGPAVVAGNHAESLIYRRVAAGEMPPGEKKLPPQDLQKLAAWIDAGAAVSGQEPETLAPGEILQAEDRGHWAFQKVQRPLVPAVSNVSQVRTPIDAFLLARLEPQGLSFRPEADRATLLRRLSLDLTGLPPTPEDVRQFQADASADAYEKQVERLLASPHYAERWARHWLDVAGYADSNGYTEQDLERKWAWKYRDYVIRSLAADKPWNQFILEQLAGDELLAQPFQNLTPEQADQLTATTFLRMGPDGTDDGAVDQNVARNDVMAETIKIVSTSLLGLTVGCAQCHNHRYDPITQVDYYRMRAIFEPAYDWKNWRTPSQRLVSLWSEETKAAAASIDKELEALNQQRTTELDKIVSDTFEKELAKLPADVQGQARQVRDTPADKRTGEQQELIKNYPFLNVDRGSVYLYLPDRLEGFNKSWDEKLAQTRTRRPADDNVACLAEIPGHIPVTKLFDRGDWNQPRQDVEPGLIAILNSENTVIPVDDPQISTSGRRLAFARHLTDTNHPLVARVLVNRFWMHHFGRGIVPTPGDFGLLGLRPTHPELLDWLADEFVRGNWQLKNLHRLIVTSSAYRQQSTADELQQRLDPDNRLLGHFPVQRLDAESLRDGLLFLSGKLSLKQFGPPVPITPDDVGQIVVGVDTRDSAGRPTDKTVALGEDEFRRSIYVQVRRSMPLSVLEPFDLPMMTPNCAARYRSTVASQSLLMMNSPFVAQQAALLADRVIALAGQDPTAQIKQAYWHVFLREPTPQETEQGLQFLSSADPSAGQTENAAAPPEMNRIHLIQLCHALVCSNGFLYVD